MVERGDPGGESFPPIENSSPINRRSSSNATTAGARLDTILETAPDGIMITNERAEILTFNKACEALLGWDAAEVVGKSATVIMTQQHADIHEESVGEYLTHGKEGVVGLTHEVHAKHKNGEAIPIELTIGEVDAPAGRQFVGVMRDLRQRNAVEARAEELQRQLLDISRRNAVDEMGAAIAHELNQPLTALTLYLQALLKKNRTKNILSDDMTEILNKAVRETERAGQIMQRMRRFGKIAVQKSKVSDIKQLVLDAMELTLVGFRRKKLSVTSSFSEDLPELQIDAVQVEQILVNLVRNAIEAVDGQPDPKIHLSVTCDTKYVSISVQDSGPGIPVEFAKNLFCTFATSKENGMGLGLAISNTIAQSHGGHIDVDPGGNGQGAKFTLNLPVSQVNFGN